jgi:hypothetical protein
MSDKRLTHYDSAIYIDRDLTNWRTTMTDDPVGARVYFAFALVAVSFGRRPLVSFHRLDLFTFGVGVWAGY